MGLMLGDVGLCQPWSIHICRVWLEILATLFSFAVCVEGGISPAILDRGMRVEVLVIRPYEARFGILSCEYLIFHALWYVSCFP
jgi:hypothetical protein